MAKRKDRPKERKKKGAPRAILKREFLYAVCLDTGSVT